MKKSRTFGARSYKAFDTREVHIIERVEIVSYTSVGVENMNIKEGKFSKVHNATFATSFIALLLKLEKLDH